MKSEGQNVPHVRIDFQRPYHRKARITKRVLQVLRLPTSTVFGKAYAVKSNALCLLYQLLGSEAAVAATPNRVDM